MADRPTGLKLDADLYQLASDVCQLTGESFKQLVTRSLEQELASRLDRKGGRLRKTLDAMREYRQAEEESGREAAA